MSEQFEENDYLSKTLTDAIHNGNTLETEKLLKLIQEIGGTVTVEPLGNNPNIRDVSNN